MHPAAIRPGAGLHRREAELSHDVSWHVEVSGGGLSHRDREIVVVVNEPTVRRGVRSDECEFYGVPVIDRDVRTGLVNRRIRKSPPSPRVAVEREVARRDPGPRRRKVGGRHTGRGRGWRYGGREPDSDEGAKEYSDHRKHRDARSVPDHCDASDSSSSLHHMEGRRHRVVVESTELRAADRVVAGLERLEPVRVNVTWDDDDLEQEIRKVA